MASRLMRVVPSIAVVSLLACSSQAVDGQPVGPSQNTPPGPSQNTPSERVQVLDPEGFETLRAAGTHDIRGPLDEITASAPCAAGEPDEACVEAARQQLREAAAKRGANLVVVVRTAVAQSFPVQYSATGEIYEITARG